MESVIIHTSIFWATENTVLGYEVEGIESDTLKQKYGDAVTAWNDLPYTGLLREERHLKTENCECDQIKDTIIDENEYGIKDRTIAGNSSILKGVI